MDRKGFRSLGDVMKDFLQESGIDKELAMNGVLNAFDEAVGKQVAKSVTSKSFNNGILKIKIDSSMVKSILFNDKDLIVKRINEIVKCNVVNSLVLY